MGKALLEIPFPHALHSDPYAEVTSVEGFRPLLQKGGDAALIGLAGDDVVEVMVPTYSGAGGWRFLT